MIFVLFFIGLFIKASIEEKEESIAFIIICITIIPLGVLFSSLDHIIKAKFAPRVYVIDKYLK
jgi:Ca2+/H+ antiporter